MARILVVDDDPDIVDLVVARLQNRGHKAQGVNGPSQALTFIEERGAPEIVVLDVTMPEMDGIELLSQLRSVTETPDLPAIFLSGRVRPEDIERGRRMGAVYLTKPFVANALFGAVDGIIEEKARRVEVTDDW